MNKKEPKCAWCESQATRLDYRSIDGVTSKLPSCDECINVSTKKLLKLKYQTK